MCGIAANVTQSRATTPTPTPPSPSTPQSSPSAALAPAQAQAPVTAGEAATPTQAAVATVSTRKQRTPHPVKMLLRVQFLATVRALHPIHALRHDLHRALEVVELVHDAKLFALSVHQVGVLGHMNRRRFSR